MVYVIEAVLTGFVKIGHTLGTAEQRAADLQTGCPYLLRVIGTMWGGPDEEADLHRMFESQLARGEWFLMDDGMRACLVAMGMRGAIEGGDRG